MVAGTGLDDAVEIGTFEIVFAERGVMDTVRGLAQVALLGDLCCVHQSSLGSFSHKPVFYLLWSRSHRMLRGLNEDSRVPIPIQVSGRVAGPGTLFGVPIGDLGWFASLLMGTATGFAAFFAGTFLGIVGIMIYNSNSPEQDRLFV